MWKFTTFLSVLCVLVLSMPEGLAALEDLNREFTENFFRLGEADADTPVLRISGTAAKVGEGSAPVTRGGGTEESESGKSDPSWVGKFLQLAIIFLLGLIVYFLSRKSRARGRY